MTFLDYLQSAEDSLFRLETRQLYDVPEETDAFLSYMQTGKLNLDYLKQWRDFVKNKVDEKVKMQRVRIISLPFNDYTRYQLEVHKENLKIGDDISIITDETFSKKGYERQDFWLIDARTVLLLNYDEHGRFLGFQPEDHVKKYVRMKNELLRDSMSLEEAGY